MSEYSNCLSVGKRKYEFGLGNCELRSPSVFRAAVLDGPWPSYYLEYEEEIFFRNMKIENSILYMWFTMLGSEDEAASYRFKVTIYMKQSEVSREELLIL